MPTMLPGPCRKCGRQYIPDPDCEECGYWWFLAPDGARPGELPDPPTDRGPGVLPAPSSRPKPPRYNPWKTTS